MPVLNLEEIIVANRKDQIKQNKKFGYTIAIFLLLITAYHLILKHQLDKIFCAITFLLLAFTLITPNRLTPVRIIWDKIGHILGVINTYLLLTLFYFFILTPLGLIIRLSGKDLLKLKHSVSLSTYWEPAIEAEESKMENQF